MKASWTALNIFILFYLFQSKNITKDCVELVDVMKNEVITPEGICENPIVITTPFINLTACVEKANDMKVQKLLKGENGVKLPDPEALFPGVELDDNTVIDVKVENNAFQIVILPPFLTPPLSS